MTKSSKLEIGTTIIMLIGILILILSKLNLVQQAMAILYPVSLLMGIIATFINGYLKNDALVDKILSWIIVVPFLVVIVFNVFFLPGYQVVDWILTVVVIGFALKIIQGKRIYFYEPIFVLEAIFRLIL